MDSAALMAVWDAIDLFGDQMTIEELDEANDLLVAAGSLEAYMRPSPTPGIARENGGKPGAGTQQLAFWNTFRSHVYERIGDLNRKRIFAFVAANRAGKTIATFVAFCQHLRDHAKNGDIYWLIAASIDSMKGVPLRTIAQLLPRAMLGGWAYNPQSNLPASIRLILPEGRGTVELWLKTENQDIQEFESEALAGWLWTECRREAIFHALQPRMLQGNCFGIMDYIPCEGWHALFKEDAALPDSMVFYVEGTVMANQHNLDAGAVRDMMPTKLGGRGTMSVEEWNLRGLGRPAAFEGVVFKQFDPEVHWRTPFKIPEYLPLYMGADWGYRNPHAFLLAVCMPDESVIGIDEEYGNECTVFEVCKRLWVKVNSWRSMSCGQWGDVETMAQALLNEQVLAKLIAIENPEAEKEGMIARPVRDHIRREWKRVLPHGCVIDASVFDRDQADGTALSDEFDRCGFPVVRSVKENKAGGVELIRRRLEQRTFTLFKTCVRHKRDLMTWRYKENKDRVPDPADVFEKKNDHGCLSAREHVLVRGRGWVSISDFRSGDDVLTPIGWRAAMRLDQGRKETWRLTFDDGTSIEGTDDHHLLTPQGWFTIGQLHIGSLIYESSRDFTCSPRVQRACLLPLRQVLSEAAGEAQGGAAACRGMDASPRQAAQGEPCSSPRRGPHEQRDREPAAKNRVGAFAAPLGEESAVAQGVRGTAGGVGQAQGDRVAQESGWSQDDGGETGVVPQEGDEHAEGENHLHHLREEADGECDLQAPEPLLRRGLVCAEGPASPTKRVVAKASSGSQLVYDLSVPGPECFILRSRVIAHNCAAVMYLLRSSPTHHKLEPEDGPKRTVHDVMTVQDARTQELIYGKKRGGDI